MDVGKMAYLAQQTEFSKFLASVCWFIVCFKLERDSHSSKSLETMRNNLGGTFFVFCCF
jgi:hypothetical protein